MMEVLARLLGVILRHGLQIVAGYLAAVGVTEDLQNEAVETVINWGVPFILSFATAAYAYLARRFPGGPAAIVDGLLDKIFGRVVSGLLIGCVSLGSLGLMGCPSKAKADESVRSFKEHVAKAKIYGRNIQIAFNESEAAGDLTKGELAVLTAGSKKFRDGLNKLSASIKLAEKFIAEGGEKRSALATLQKILDEDVIKTFTELERLITGNTKVSAKAAPYIIAARVAFASMRILLSQTQMELGGQNA
jgi:outer membrane murein-binding lipoprotein Lpp